MRILVTGATGFLGSYLIRDLLEQGHEVIAVIRSGTDPWRIADVLSQVAVVNGSVNELSQLQSGLADRKPEAVVHMAWRGVGNMDRNSPIQARNISDAVELAALAADLGVKVFVGAGSQAEYGPYQSAIREGDAPRPTTLYGIAKLAAGSMAGQLAAERRMRFAWLRIFSTYGPRDADYWLIPSMIKTLRAGRRMPLTACEQQWGFLHASDAAAAFRIVVESEAAHGIYNLGSPEAPRLRDTVSMLRDYVNPAAELGFGDVPYRADQVMVLKADVRRLMGLGWQPRVPLSTGLRDMVRWYDTGQHS